MVAADSHLCHIRQTLKSCTRYLSKSWGGYLYWMLLYILNKMFFISMICSVQTYTATFTFLIRDQRLSNPSRNVSGSFVAHSFMVNSLIAHWTNWLKANKRRSTPTLTHTQTHEGNFRPLIVQLSHLSLSSWSLLPVVRFLTLPIHQSTQCQESFSLSCSVRTSQPKSPSLSEIQAS